MACAPFILAQAAWLAGAVVQVAARGFRSNAAG